MKRARIGIPPAKKQKTSIDLEKINKEVFKSKEKTFLRFSFKYLNLQDPDYNVVKPKDGDFECDNSWFIKLFERKKALCGMSLQEIKQSGKATRCHRIDWSKTKKPKGFGIKALSPDVDDETYQMMGISKGRGRLLGFFIETTFYLVLIDPYHKLYS